MAAYTHHTVAGSPPTYWGDLDSTYVSASSTFVVLANTDGSRTTLLGSGFTFTGSGSGIVLTGGTIIAMGRTDSTVSILYEQINGFSYAATSFQNHMGEPNLNGIMADVFNGVDTFTGFNGDDIMKGFAGRDTFFSSAGNDTFDGGTVSSLVANETANYTSGSITGGIVATLSSTSTVVGDASVGTDTLIAIDRIRGTQFADIYTVSTSFFAVNANFARIEGGGGNDVITGSATASGGNVRAEYILAGAAVFVDLANGTARSLAAGDPAGVGTDTLTNVIGVFGSSFDDVLTAAGGRGQFHFYGGPGNDTITGTSEGISAFDFNQVRYDTFGLGLVSGIVATLGATSTVSGDVSVGTDTLINVESVRGTSFADTYTVNAGFSAQFGLFNDFEGLGANDTITGNGTTRISYTAALAAVTVNLGTGSAASSAGGDAAGIGVDSFTGVNSVNGSAFDDTLTGSGNAVGERFRGNAGNDTIDGAGGSLLDNADYRSSPAGIVADLAAGTASDGFGGTDTLANIFGIRGSEFNDVMNGNGSDNRFSGRGGNDTISGGAGNDILVGDDNADPWGGAFGTGNSSNIGGADTLSGGAGNDTLTGGLGNDTLDGGLGVDTAVFAGSRSAYTIQPSVGALIVSGPDGIDTLTKIERLQFDDVMVPVPVFGAPALKLGAFNPANGWTNDDQFHRELADVNGDGMADIIGFGIPGVLVSLATGGGNFAAPTLNLAAFNPANGWTNDDQFHRELADVNGDGMADIVGFGTPGVLVSLATGGGNFAAPSLKLAAFNPANGWTSDDQFHRELADVNGDGMADIIGFGTPGVLVSLATGGGNFAAPSLNLAAFNPPNGWTNDDQFHRELADVNGDGMADIVGFGTPGVLVSLATGGGNFAAPTLKLAAFNPGNGWTSDDQFPRELADVNGDGMADIIGFGTPGVLVSLATGGGNFEAPILDRAMFNPPNGWTSNNQFHREVADVNGDHGADIVGFGIPGVLVSLANDFLIA